MKLQPIYEIESTCKSLKKNKVPVVLAHGCFDLLHVGHVEHLQAAKEFGGLSGCLIVSITDDQHILKGKDRPVFTAVQRAKVLAALGCVSYVVINPHPTAVPILEVVKPDYFVKGPACGYEKTKNLLEEIAIVNRYGGRVEYTTGDIHSSSQLAKKVVDYYG
jgi:rfaE bifunctional protein nucleotidyltransferase chain/domain